MADLKNFNPTQLMGEKLNSTSMDCLEGAKKTRNEICCIDKEMIPFKAHFFLFYGAMGSMMPYLPLIAKDRIGITATSTAAVVTTQLFVTMVTKVVLGYVADYFKRMKIMISVLIIAHCLCSLFLLFIPTAKLLHTKTSISFDHFFENDTEHTVMLLNMTTHCNLYSSYHHRNIDKAGHLRYEVGSGFNIVCLRPTNFTEKMLCCKVNNHNKNKTFLPDVQLNFDCSTYSDQMKQLEDEMKSVGKNIFHLNISTSSSIYESFNENISCNSVLVDNSKKKEAVSDFIKYQFWLYAFLMVIERICSSSAYTLSDTVCCDSVHKNKKDFGRQRLFSAVGWGALAPLGGFLCDITDDFYSTWSLMAVMQGFTLWNLCKMNIVTPQFSQNLGKDVAIVLKSKTFLAFNMGIFVSGVWGGAIWYYLVWFVSSLGGNTLVCGLIPYMQCFAGEIPFMFISGWIIKKLGHFNVISLSLLSYAVRFLWYSYLQNPWMVLPIELTHGITYGLTYPSIASFGKVRAKPGTEALIQSLLFSTHEGLGAGLGCVLTGVCFDQFGGHVTFFYFSLFAFGSTFLNICNTLLFGKHTDDCDPTPK